MSNQKPRPKTVFVHGRFEVLHPGHLRLLKFAKENGDRLVVGVYSDRYHKCHVPEELRLEAVKISIFVDEAFLIEDSIEEYVKRLKPDVIVKGSEHENGYNPEEKILKNYGGKLIFSSGESRFSSLELLRAELHDVSSKSIRLPADFPKRHAFGHRDLHTVIERMDTLKAIIVGDVIVDEYIACEPLGMSQEDPTIVVSPILSEKFLGGAGIVAAHARGLGAEVAYFGVTGCDEGGGYVRQKLEEYRIKVFCYGDETRPTNLKQRFRAGNKTLLRVNHLKQHHISKEIQSQIIKDIEKEMSGAHLLIFSDFSYGCLPQSLINTLIALGKKHGLIMCADSQSSSQTGDIARFPEMHLVTPTEREIRLAVDDFESGLMVISEKLAKKSKPKNIFITLASEGVVINSYETNGDLHTDRLPAMNSNPKDVAGAGDSMLATAGLALAAGAGVWQAGYLGSIAAACQVSRVGNLPLRKEDIIMEIKDRG